MKKTKWLSIVLTAMLCCGVSSIPVFAQTNEPAASTESVPPETTEEPAETAEEPEKLDPLTPDGNLTLVDDISTKSGKQFITVVTKNGNYFYLIIDRDDEGEQTVHFLNQVDEEDLLNLMDDEDADAIRESLDQQKTQETVTPEPEEKKEEPETTVEPVEKKKSSNNFMLPAVVVLVAAIGGIGVWIFLQAKRKKGKPADHPDPDADYRTESA